MVGSLTPLLILLAAVAATGAVGSFVAYMVIPKESHLVSTRLQQYAPPAATSLRDLELRAPFSERVTKPIVRGLSNLVASRTPEASIAKIRLRLVVAGRAADMSVADFLGSKGLIAILIGITATGVVFLTHVAFIKGAIIIAVGIFVGYFFPDLWLRQEANRRRLAIQRALPDALDLLTIMVEAGLGFEGALQRLVDKAVNPLTQEFGIMLAEIRLGKSSREALKALSDRCDVDDLSTFVSSLIQAQQLGVALARVLRIQSFQMRLKRRQRAEEKARQAPIKMLFPMAFLTFPAMFIVILGPAVPTVMSLMGGTH